MLLDISRQIKYLTSFSESEILQAMSLSDIDNVEALSQGLSRISHEIRNIPPSTSGSHKKKTQSKKPATRKERVESIMTKIKDCLREYEANDPAIDDCRMKFKMGVDYRNWIWDDVKIQHQNLAKTDINCNKIKLLTFLERGYLYNYLKNFYREKPWKQCCAELGICRSTVTRYMQFSEIIRQYPRLIICELTFETIVSFFKEIEDIVKDDDELSIELKKPLREIKIHADMTFSGDKLAEAIGTDHDSGAIKVDTSKQFDWAPHYIATDKARDLENTSTSDSN